MENSLVNNNFFTRKLKLIQAISILQWKEHMWFVQNIAQNQKIDKSSKMGNLMVCNHLKQTHVIMDFILTISSNNF